MIQTILVFIVPFLFFSFYICLVFVFFCCSIRSLRFPYIYWAWKYILSNLCFRRTGILFEIILCGFFNYLRYTAYYILFILFTTLVCVSLSFYLCSLFIVWSIFFLLFKSTSKNFANFSNTLTYNKFYRENRTECEHNTEKLSEIVFCWNLIGAFAVLKIKDTKIELNKLTLESLEKKTKMEKAKNKQR